AQPAVFNEIEGPLPEAEGTPGEPQGQGNFPKRPVSLFPWRQPNWVHVAAPMVGGAVVLPGGVRHDRCVRKKSLVTKEHSDDRATGVAAAAEARWPKAGGDEPLVDILELGNHHLGR